MLRSVAVYSRMAHQHLEHGEFTAGQCNRITIAAQFAGRQVELIAAKAHHLLGGRGGPRQLDGVPAQHGADPGQQLTGVERLGQVIIGTHLEPDDAIHLIPLGGQHQHRDLAVSYTHLTLPTNI